VATTLFRKFVSTRCTFVLLLLELPCLVASLMFVETLAFLFKLLTESNVFCLSLVNWLSICLVADYNRELYEITLFNC
jgi:hypothetical protein